MATYINNNVKFQITEFSIFSIYLLKVEVKKK